MEDEWMPSLEEYNPNITKEQWIELVKDKEIFNEKSLIVFACIQKATLATCKDMANEFGRNIAFYNDNVWRTGKRVYDKINCPLFQRENGSDRFWSICCLGKYSKTQDEIYHKRFEYKIRPELQEAFDETGVLEGVDVMGDKEKISCIMANIAWNYNEWKQPSDNKTNFRWTQQEGNIAHESWNFDFDNPRNNENEILGYTKFKNPPKNAEKDKFLIIFRSSNKIIGFYGNAEIKKVPLVIKDNESVNLLGDKKLSLLLENKIDDSNHIFLFGKERISQGGFNKIDNKDAIMIIDEAIKLNPSQIEVLNKLKDWLIQGESQMQNDLINETKTLLENTKNLILTGAPGTGKTYLAKQIAKAMGCEDNEIGFVQFHPSYDYTDFVEGLRPVQNDGSNQIGFERKDGVFKEFCGKALTVTDEDIEKFFEKDTSFEVEGDKTTFNVSIEDDNLTIQSNEYRNHFDGTKEELVEYNKSLKDDKNAKLGDKKKIQELVYKKILTDIKQKKFVFIIDEINRGEVSKIFGELFYCIDPGYRGEKGRISTQYQNLVTSGEFQKGFFIPENVYIIGTMNDIDRSVESMDFAFRRRFAWKEITADNTQYMLDEVEKDGVIYGLPSEIVDEAKKRMNRLNNKISELPDFNSAYHIGASYFLKLNQLDGDFESLWNYHLKGILEEYLRGNPEKDKYMTQLKTAYDKKDVTNE